MLKDTGVDFIFLSFLIESNLTGFLNLHPAKSSLWGNREDFNSNHIFSVINNMRGEYFLLSKDFPALFLKIIL